MHIHATKFLATRMVRMQLAAALAQVDAAVERQP
jgi:hypothetical protein